MRHFIAALLGATALAGISAQNATAADLPTKGPSYVSQVSAYNWTGFYAGANLGYGWANASATATLTGTPGSLTASENLNGVLGGGQIGYNWQTGNLVLGLEADIQATGQSSSWTASGGGNTVTETDKIPYFGTVRGRLGWAIDRWMPYVTGGWGYGGFSSSLTGTGGGGSVAFSSSQSHSAWVLGVGVEAALVGNWTWKIEYLYLDTGTITNNYTIPAGLGGGTITVGDRVKDNVVRLGLNYRF
jgi:outer membrane immunogenic protein